MRCVLRHLDTVELCCRVLSCTESWAGMVFSQVWSSPLGTVTFTWLIPADDTPDDNNSEEERERMGCEELRDSKQVVALVFPNNIPS
jgi:hypothetical protein